MPVVVLLTLGGAGVSAGRLATRQGTDDCPLQSLLWIATRFGPGALPDSGLWCGGRTIAPWDLAHDAVLTVISITCSAMASLATHLPPRAGRVQASATWRCAAYRAVVVQPLDVIRLGGVSG